MAGPGPALGLLAETLFPGRCLLCGGWLLLTSNHVVPVCDSCLGSIPALQGERCAKCGIELISEKNTCLRCRGADFMFDSNMSLFAYTGSARRLLTSLKFEGRRRLALFFAARAASLLETTGWDGPVVPVPPRPGRRAPDPAELVARALEKRHGVHVLRVLARSVGAQQKSLDFEQRKLNLRGQVRLVHGAEAHAIPPRAVLLDDVFTTGATLDACARVLRQAGLRVGTRRDARDGRVAAAQSLRKDHGSEPVLLPARLQLEGQRLVEEAMQIRAGPGDEQLAARAHKTPGRRGKVRLPGNPRDSPRSGDHEVKSPGRKGLPELGLGCARHGGIGGPIP